MSIFDGIISGFFIALTPMNLMFGFLGALIGTAVGVLPGLSHRHHRAASAHHLFDPFPSSRRYFDGWDILWGHVRRVHDVDSAQPAG